MLKTVAWLEHHLKTYEERLSPSPMTAIPGQCRRMDSGTGSGRGNPLEGELLFLAGTETESPAQRGKTETERQKTLERELDWIRMKPQGPPRQIQGPHLGL
jgi:hypothetical protein